MPYKRIGKSILHKKGGTWKVKQRCDSVSNAKKAMRLLQMVGHGGTPRKK